MTSVPQADEIILSNLYHPTDLRLPFSDATGYVLSENIYADRPFPPFNRVAMDGIAIDFSSWEKGRRQYAVYHKVAAAGSPQQLLPVPMQCIEVMTGAVLPLNCDTVIRYEDLIIKDGIATVADIPLTRGKNVHLKGKNGGVHDLLLSAGDYIGASEIAIAATVGKTNLQVKRPPSLAIVSTGDELVEVDKIPEPHQIRVSNSYQIRSLLTFTGGATTQLVHLPDDKAVIDATFPALLAEFDGIILTGGVSKGKYDYLPTCLAAAGVEKLFHRVAQRPGKPFWFGKSATNTVVFALPGNPVSAYACTLRYVLPWLRQSLGLPQPSFVYAALSEAITFQPSLTLLQPGWLSISDRGQATVSPKMGGGSGDMTRMVSTNALIELPPEPSFFEKGYLCKVYQ